MDMFKKLLLKAVQEGKVNITRLFFLITLGECITQLQYMKSRRLASKHGKTAVLIQNYTNVHTPSLSS